MGLLTGCAPSHTANSNWHYYGQLSAPLQANYRAVHDAVDQSWDNECAITTDGGKVWGVAVSLPCPLSHETELTQVYTAVTRDHPEWFFLGDRYGYEQNENGQYTVMALSYDRNAEKRRAAAARLETACEQLQAALPADVDEFEREVAVHDALLLRCDYAAQQTSSSRSAYGALVEGSAVCEGYAKGLQYLIQRIGMEATVVTGENGDGAAHMWTVAVMGGEWYHIDPTLNDNTPLPHHTYFNLSDQQISKTHHMESPFTCDGEAHYYFTKRQYRTNSLRTETVALLLAEQLKTRPVAELQFDSEDSFQNARTFARNTVWLTETMNAYTCEKTGYTVAFDELHRTLYIGKKSEENS